MIQFNLLPDVKLEYIKARRLKRTVMISSVAVAGVSVTILILLFSYVNFAQKRHMDNLSNDIKSESKQLQGKQDLNKILTVQNQLGSLSSLHGAKPVTSRTFIYIQQVTPANVTISSLSIDYEKQTMEIKGEADSLAGVNTFVDTLKFTDYQLNETDGEGATKTAAPVRSFSSVVLSSFSRDEKVAYGITLKFDPVIFKGDSNVSLVVPKQVTTRSLTEKPGDIFQQGGAQ